MTVDACKNDGDCWMPLLGTGDMAYIRMIFCVHHKNVAATATHSHVMLCETTTLIVRN